jgi:hypothetical protein
VFKFLYLTPEGKARVVLYWQYLHLQSIEQLRVKHYRHPKATN